MAPSPRLGDGLDENPHLSHGSPSPSRGRLRRKPPSQPRLPVPVSGTPQTETPISATAPRPRLGDGLDENPIFVWAVLAQPIEQHTGSKHPGEKERLPTTTHGKGESFKEGINEDVETYCSILHLLLKTRQTWMPERLLIDPAARHKAQPVATPAHGQ